MKKMPPKPTKKPVTPKEAKQVQASMNSAGRAEKGDMALMKMNTKPKYKCGGGVKKYASGGKTCSKKKPK